MSTLLCHNTAASLTRTVALSCNKRRASFHFFHGSPSMLLGGATADQAALTPWGERTHTMSDPTASGARRRHGWVSSDTVSNSRVQISAQRRRRVGTVQHGVH